jgi:hypothetical protein
VLLCASFQAKQRGLSAQLEKLVAPTFARHPSGGVVLVAKDDLLRWDVALRAGKVVPPDLLKRAWTPRTLPDGTLSGYGYGWKLCTLAGRPTIEHGGFINGFQANLLRLPDDGLTIAVLVNNDADEPNPGVIARRLARFLLTGAADLRLSSRPTTSAVSRARSSGL